MRDYSMTALELKAADAKLACSAYLDGLEAAYRERQAWRAENGIPAVAFCGMGRAGKDTAAAYWCAITGAKYPESNSRVVLPLVTHMLGAPASAQEEVYAERHQHREYWIEACHAIRGPDYALIARICLGAGDLTVGTRGLYEIDAIRRDEVVDFALWIDRDVPSDPTVEYGKDDCDLVVTNYGSRLELFSRLRKLVRILKADWYRPKTRNS